MDFQLKKTLDESEALLLDSEEANAKSHLSRFRGCVLSPFLGLFVFAVSIIGLWNVLRLDSGVWDTDFADARRAIHYEHRTFTGALEYDATKNRVIRIHDAPIEYFGQPGAEIDEAWEDLLRNEFPTMSRKEAGPYRDKLLPLPSDGEYHFEPSVYHSLHCINALRIALVPMLYNTNVSSHHQDSALTRDPLWKVTHIEHCLDQLRQTVMCHGDLTPAPLYTWPKFPVSLGVSGVHTCRKWEPIRLWMEQRAQNGKALAEP